MKIMNMASLEGWLELRECSFAFTSVPVVLLGMWQTDRQTAAQCDGSCQYYATRDAPRTSLTQTTNSQFSCSTCSSALSTALTGRLLVLTALRQPSLWSAHPPSALNNTQFIIIVSTATCAILRDLQNKAVQSHHVEWRLCLFCCVLTTLWGRHM